VDGGARVPAGEVRGRRRGVRRRHHGDQGDQDDAFRRRAAHVPRVRAGHAPRRVLRGEVGAGPGVAAAGGWRGRRHGGADGVHHRHETPAPSSRRAKELIEHLKVTTGGTN